MTMVIKHSTNIVQHRKNQHDSQLPKEKCSKRLYLAALSQAKNITKILANLMIAVLMKVIFATLETAKSIYQQIKDENFKKKTKTREYVFKYLRIIFERV